MLFWKPSNFTSNAAYFVVAWIVSGTAVPLFAQALDAADSTEPLPPATTQAPAATAPPAAETPSQQQTSAATTPSDSAVSDAGSSAVSPAAGITPVSGPGAPVTPILGDHLGSAFTSQRIPFRVTATLAEAYSDNIFAQPQHAVDYITRLTLRGEAQFGNLLAVDGNYLDVFYSPSLHLYVRHPHENGVDNDVDVLYAHHFSRLTLSLEQIYSSIQSTDASVGGLVTTDKYTTIAKADFVYSHKLDFVSSYRQEFVDYDVAGYTNSKQWSGELYALYHFDDKVSFGLGPNIGYLILQDAPDEHFQQILGRVIYAPNQELTIQAVAGGEDREFQTSARSDTLTPIFKFTGSYVPNQGTMANPPTTIAINASRHYTPSYNFVGEDYLATNVNISATQRFLRNYYFGLVAGYENDDYQYVANPGGGPTRVDNFYYLQPTLSWKPNAALALAVFDKYEEDDSNFTIYAYNANQVGVSATAVY